MLGIASFRRYAVPLAAASAVIALGLDLMPTVATLFAVAVATVTIRRREARQPAVQRVRSTRRP